MKQKKLLACAHQCMKDGQPCKVKSCRFNINYEQEYNCCLVSIYENGELTLRQIAEREGISFARIKQIQDKALFKKKKTNSDIF